MAVVLLATGMPGSLTPDILIIEEKFPPSASTVRAIVACGFQFVSLAPHGNTDYWFQKPIPADDIGPERSMALHLIDKTDAIGRVILRLRDACNNDPAAFEEYKVMLRIDFIYILEKSTMDKKLLPKDSPRYIISHSLVHQLVSFSSCVRMSTHRPSGVHRLSACLGPSVTMKLIKKVKIKKNYCNKPVLLEISVVRTLLYAS